MAKKTETREELKERISELEGENESLQDQLDAIADIVVPAEEDEDGGEEEEDDDNGNDESCHFITPKSHFRNYNCEAELKTLYCVLRRLLKLHNSKWNANLPLHQALISFVSSCCSLTAQSERHRFQKCFESYL